MKLSDRAREFIDDIQAAEDELDELNRQVEEKEEELAAGSSPRYGDLGETIEVRDFNGAVVESIRITADGQYQTSKQGLIPASRLGLYIVQVTGHPARARVEAQPLVST